MAAQFVAEEWRETGPSIALIKWNPCRQNIVLSQGGHSGNLGTCYGGVTIDPTPRKTMFGMLCGE